MCCCCYSILVPFYAYFDKTTNTWQEFRPIVDNWSSPDIILSTVLAIAALICELPVRLNRAALGLATCSVFLITWRSIFVLESKFDLKVGFFLYVGGGLLALLGHRSQFGRIAEVLLGKRI